MHYAAMKCGNVKIAKLLVANGARVDVRGRQDCTPIMKAALVRENPLLIKASKCIQIVSIYSVQSLRTALLNTSPSYSQSSLTYHKRLHN